MNIETEALVQHLAVVEGLLQHKVREVSGARGDIGGVASVQGLAVLLVDADMCISAFTPHGARLFDLTADDIGRPLTDVLPQLRGGAGLERSVQGAKREVAQTESVVSDEGAERVPLSQSEPTREIRAEWLLLGFIGVGALRTLRAQVALAKRRLEAVLAIVDNAIIGVGPGGTVVEFSRGSERLFSRPARTAIGRRLERLLKPDAADDDRGSIMRLLEHSSPAAAQIVSGRGIRENGDSFPVAVHALKVAQSEGYVLRVEGLVEQRGLARRIVEISTLEQERIGQLIHDGLGQQLAGVAMLAAALADKLEKQQRPEAPEAAYLKDELEHSLVDARAIIRGLSPAGIAPGGLVEALKRLGDQCVSTTGVHCKVQTEVGASTMDRLVASHLYRIAQEGLAYALRYAKPSRIEILLRQSRSHWRLLICDDGEWVDKAQNGADALELRMMAYRAGILGGTLTVKPRATGGKRVLCEIPRVVDTPR